MNSYDFKKSSIFFLIFLLLLFSLTVISYNSKFSSSIKSNIKTFFLIDRQFLDFNKGFYEVAKEYKAEKGQFNTWLGNKTFWTCHNYMSRSKKTSEINDWDGNEYSKSDIEEIYEYVKNNITDKEDKFILIKRLEGHTLKEIEDLFDGKYSYEWVRQKYNRQIDRFKKILTKEIY